MVHVSTTVLHVMCSSTPDLVSASLPGWLENVKNDGGFKKVHTPVTTPPVGDARKQNQT